MAIFKGGYTEEMIWGMKPSQFVGLERDADLIRREQVADMAKAVAMGNSQNPHDSIVSFLDGDFW